MVGRTTLTKATADVKKGYTVALLIMMAGVCFMPEHGRLPLLGLHTINIPDVVLYILIAVLYGRLLLFKEARLARTPLDLPVLLLVFVATANLVFRHALMSQGFLTAFSEYKIYVYYMAIILVVNFYQTERDLRFFLGGAFLLAAVVGATLLMKAAAGDVHPSASTAIGNPGDVYYLFWAQGILLEFWVFCTMLSLSIVHKFSGWYTAVGMLCLMFLVMSFSRHWWISVAFSAVFILYMTKKRYLSRVVKLLVILFMMVLALESAVLAGIKPFSHYQQLILYRGSSLGWIDTTGSYTYRVLEDRYALQTISHHPLLGIGFRTPYRPQIYFPVDGINSFIHNGYLWILLKMGIAGFLPFVLMSVMFVGRAWTRWSKIKSPLLRGVALGSLSSFLGIALADVTAPHFVQNWDAVFVPISIGVTEAIYRIDAHRELFCE